MPLRGGTIVLKFGLSLYVARFIGLGELGLYGLVVGATLSMLGCAALFAHWPWRGGPPLREKNSGSFDGR